MMLFLAFGVSIIMIGIAVINTRYAVSYVRFLFPGQTARSDPQSLTSQETAPEAFEELGEVAVVLCLRDSHPSLIDCLTGIDSQEYEKFQLYVVVDREDDPALDVVRAFYASTAALPQIHVITTIHDTCSLKCSAIVDAISKIPTHHQVIAFLDAGTVPDQYWLRDLIAPLKAPDVGATTGSRWFAPSRPVLGAYVRKVWNAAAMVAAINHQVAWGGTFAIKRSAIDRCQLLDRWRHAFREETLLAKTLSEHGLRLVRIPHLIVENTDSPTLRDVSRWIVRELVTVRLHHAKWKWVKRHAWATAIGGIGVLALIGIAYLLNQGKAFYLLAGGFVLYQAWNFLLFILIEILTKRVIDSRNGFNHDPDMPSHLFSSIAAYMIAQVVYPVACWRADRMSVARWCGIEYDINDNRQIKLREYVPHFKIQEKEDARDSARISIASGGSS